MPVDLRDDWSPELYDRFAAERRQPFFDLLALVQRAPGMRVVDLGCGTGALTRILHERLDARDTLGIDASAAMLAKAEPTARCRFLHADIATFSPPAPVDLLFSNAALHWVPDHRALFTRLAAAIAPGGQLAVQVPANFDAPSHTIADAVAAEAPFRDALAGYARIPPVLPPETYAVLLHDLGFRAPHVRLQVYCHVLPDRDAVVEWVRGTVLTDFTRRLPPSLAEAFVARYAARLRDTVPDARPFVFPYKRLLLWGRYSSEEAGASDTGAAFSASRSGGS